MIQLPEIDRRIWYRTYYTIPFTGRVADDHSEDYVIYLEHADNHFDPIPEVRELDGGPRPFVFSFDDNAELLPTTRVSRAQISFVDDISLDSLIAESGISWRVRLVRSSDDAEVFVGYLSGESFTQPYIDGVNIITVNAVSPTVPMMATPMPIIDYDMMTVGEALALMVKEMYQRVKHEGRGLQYIYIPAIFATADEQSDFTKVLRFKFPAWNFVKKNEDYILTGEEYVSDTYAELVNALCLFFGWTMCDIGDDCIYFVSPAHKGDYMQLTVADLTAEEAFTPVVVRPSILGQDAIIATDTADTADYRQGVSAITIDVAATEAAFELPDITQQVQKWSIERRTYGAEIDFYYYPSDTTIVSSYGAKKTPTLTEGNVSFPQYQCILTEQSNGLFSQTWVEVEDVDTAEGAIFQGQYFESDFGDYNDTIANSENVIRKRSWNFDKIYRIEEGRLIDMGKITPVLMWIPEDLPVIKFRQRVTALHNGALVINFSLRATAIEGFFIPQDFHIAGGNISEPKVGSVKPTGYTDEFYQYSYYPTFWGDLGGKKVSAVLKVGDLYWDGSEWVDYYSIFSILIDPTPAEWHGVISNKTVDMPYSGDQGFYIPVTAELVGDVEFWILSGLTRPGDTGAGPAGADYSRGLKLASADIADLSITYAQEIDYVAVNSAQKKYYKALGRQYPNTTEVSLPLHSSLGTADYVSLMRLPNSAAIDTLWIDGEEKKPEVYLLDEYERLYGRVIRRWRRGMPQTSLLPIDIFSGDSDDVSLMITGLSVDFADGTQSVHLSEVKNKNIIYE